MSRVDQSGIVGKIRDQPITAELESILDAAAVEVGIDRVFVYSGGQPGTHGRRTGGPRHNGGRAADLMLMVDGTALRFTNSSAPAKVKDFVTECARLGATGIGAATNYMGPANFHIGFGLSVNDQTKVVWGRGGRAVNAPKWLSAAAQAGWNTASHSTATLFLPPSERFIGTHEVMARSGLNVRKGPGVQFSVSAILPLGTTIEVLGYHEQAPEWARVDLNNDGVVDGFVFADYLRVIDVDGSEEETSL